MTLNVFQLAAMNQLPPRHQHYDYSSLSSEKATLLHERTTELKRMAGEASAQIIEIGKALQAVKEMLPHGEFGRWLSSEFPWTPRSAQRMMQVYEAFGRKSDIVSALEPTSLYMLAAPTTSEEVREEAVRRLHDGGVLTLPTVKAMVDKDRAAQKESRAVIDGSTRFAAPSRIEKAEAAAQFIVDALGEDTGKLGELLAGVDATALVKRLREALSVRNGGPLTEIRL